MPFEKQFLFIVSIGCFIISIGDLFDLFHLVTPEHMSTLCFLLLAIILGSLAFLQDKIPELYKDLKGLRAETELDQIRHTVDQIDPTLLKIFGIEYFIEVFEFLQAATKEHKVTVNTTVRFLHYFVHTLQHYSRATFCLAIPVTACNNADLEAVLHQFVKRGGKLKCILFVEDAGELASPEFQAFQMRQAKLGIRLIVIMYSFVPDNLKKSFVVESKGKVLWELQIDEKGNIEAGTVIRNRKIISRYYRSFERLLRAGRLV